MWREDCRAQTVPYSRSRCVTLRARKKKEWEVHLLIVWGSCQLWAPHTHLCIPVLQQAFDQVIAPSAPGVCIPHMSLWRPPLQHPSVCPLHSLFKMDLYVTRLWVTEEKGSEALQEAPRPLQWRPFYDGSRMVTNVCVCMCVSFFVCLSVSLWVRLSVCLPAHHTRDALHVSVTPWNDEMIIFFFSNCNKGLSLFHNQPWDTAEPHTHVMRGSECRWSSGETVWGLRMLFEDTLRRVTHFLLQRIKRICEDFKTRAKVPQWQIEIDKSYAHINPLT